MGGDAGVGAAAVVVLGHLIGSLVMDVTIYVLTKDVAYATQANKLSIAI